MKISAALATSLAVLLAASAASAAKDPYKAVLNGEQETPSNAATGTGTTKNLQYDTVTKHLTGEVDLTGLSGTATAQHIHEEQCGVSGAVLYALPAPAANKITFDQVLTAADLTALVNGKLYINVHTAAHPGGEIRGQIYPEASALVCLGANDGGAGDASADSGSDAGKDAGSSSGSSGSSGTSGASSSGTSGASSSGTSGATSSGGTSGTSGTTADGGSSGGGGDSGGGCATASSDDTSGGVAMAALAGLGIAIVVRSRKKHAKASSAGKR